MEEQTNEALWYVVHTYSGYENKVANDLQTMVENRHLQDLICDIKVPTEMVPEIKDGKERMVEHKLFPGYVLVKMVMNDDTWYVVRNTRGCTGFVGPASKPVPLSAEEVEKMGVEKAAPLTVDFNVGDTVQITAGPLEGFMGLVEGIDTEFIGAGSVVFYTLVGGFLAVSRTDFIQGVMMFFAILVVPICAAMQCGGFESTVTAIQHVQSTMLEPLTKPDGSTMNAIELISLLAWGIGYFGQPHILVRFMAIRTSKEVKQATHIAMTWVILSLAAAVAVGMVGRVYLTTPLEGTASETVFLVMTNELFPPIATGLILSAVLAAIMSTASSQLLVAASAFAQDFYRTLLRKDAEQKELVWISRASVLVIASLAIFLGLNPNNFILDMVSYAWAGFGAAFGPALLMSLFWRHTTKYGVLVGIIVGGVTVLVWKQYALFGLYEIVPGFLFSTIAIWAVSWLDRVPEASILETFDKVGKSKI